MAGLYPVRSAVPFAQALAGEREARKDRLQRELMLRMLGRQAEAQMQTARFGAMGQVGAAREAGRAQAFTATQRRRAARDQALAGLEMAGVSGRYGVQQQRIAGEYGLRGQQVAGETTRDVTRMGLPAALKMAGSPEAVAGIRAKSEKEQAQLWTDMFGRAEKKAEAQEKTVDVTSALQRIVNMKYGQRGAALAELRATVPSSDPAWSKPAVLGLLSEIRHREEPGVARETGSLLRKLSRGLGQGISELPEGFAEAYRAPREIWRYLR